MVDAFKKEKSYLAMKFHEGMIAFSGFLLDDLKGNKSKEGILKISCSTRPYRGDQLTLTFIVDTEESLSLQQELASRFQQISEATLKPHLGDELERIAKIPVETITHLEQWYIEEVNLFLRSLKGQKKTFIEKDLVPTLEKLLTCSFQPIEWWPEQKLKGKLANEPHWDKHPDLTTFKSLFHRWFGMGKD
jgi:hypothetical protein